MRTLGDAAAREGSCGRGSSGVSIVATHRTATEPTFVTPTRDGERGMPTIANKARERLAAGQLSLGMALRQARTVDIGRVLAACGFDFAFIDMEHNTMGVDTAAQIA